MEYLFTQLEAKVATLCQRLPNSQEAKTAVSELSQETILQQKELEKVLLGTFSEEELKEFTGRHHWALLQMIVELDEKAGAPHLKKKERFNLRTAAQTSSLGIAYAALHRLLKFFQYHFERYIPKEKSIPSFCHRAWVREMKEFQRYVVKHLKDLDPELSVMVIKPFVEFVKLPKYQTWHNFYYCHLFFNDFKTLVAGRQTITEDELTRFLLFINYNSVEFYNYYLESLLERGPDLPGLYLLKKELALTPVKANIAYHPEMKGLVDLLKLYVDVEIDYLEHTGKKGIEDPAKKKANGSELPNRVPYNISVERLSFKYRVDVELGIIDKGTAEDLYRLIANISSTPNAKYPSSKNVKNDYLNPTDATMAAELQYHRDAIAFIEKKLNT